MKSVKLKIIILVVSAIILSSISIGGASILHSRSAVKEDSAQIMNLLCENKAAKINELFTKVEQSVETLSVYALHQFSDAQRFENDPSYANEISDHMLDVALNAGLSTQGAMTVYLRFNPEFTDSESGFFYQLDSEQNSYIALQPTNLADYDASDLANVGWFYQPKEKREGLWMNPYYNENIDTKIISYVIPLYFDSIFVGVIGMDINFAVLENILANTTVYETGGAFLADRDAHILYHKDLAVGTDLVAYNNGEFHMMAEAIKDDKVTGNDLVSYTYQGVKKKAAYRSLYNDTRLVIAVPESEINEQANILLLQILLSVVIVSLLAIIFTVMLSKRLTRPLLELKVAAEKIAAGDLSVTITHQSKDEVGNLAECFRSTVDNLQKYISYINELAYRDSLTGAKNKTSYLEAVSNLDERILNKQAAFAIAVFDINYLKRVNDSYGHSFGDVMIVNTCQVIFHVFKHSSLYRIGGDEFVIILENEDLKQKDELHQLFYDRIAEFNEHAHDKIKISVACGIAEYQKDSDLKYNDVFVRADNRMYQNKEDLKHMQEDYETF